MTPGSWVALLVGCFAILASVSGWFRYVSERQHKLDGAPSLQTQIKTVADDIARLIHRFEQASARLSDKESKNTHYYGELTLRVVQLESEMRLRMEQAATDHARYDAEIQHLWKAAGRRERDEGESHRG